MENEKKFSLKKFSLKGILNTKRLIVAAILLLFVVAVIVFNPGMRSYLFGPKNIKVSVQSGTEFTSVDYGNEMIIVSMDGVRAVDRNGKDVWSVVHKVTTPVVAVKDHYYMIADLNGTSVQVYKKNKLVSDIKTESEILTAKLNKNGNVVVVTDHIGYKGAVIVYGKGGREDYRWYSGNGYIGDIDISPDGKYVAVSQLMTDKEKIHSRIVMLNTRTESEGQEIADLDGIAMTLRYKDNGELVAVSDNGVCTYKRSGKQVMSIDFGGRTPLMYNIENPGNLVFAFENNINNTVLESYSARGKLRGKYEAKGEVKAFDVNGECIIAASGNNVIRVTPSGKIKERISLGHDIREVRLFAGRKKFLSSGGGGVDINSLK